MDLLQPQPRRVSLPIPLLQGSETPGTCQGHRSGEGVAELAKGGMRLSPERAGFVSFSAFNESHVSVLRAPAPASRPDCGEQPQSPALFPI